MAEFNIQKIILEYKASNPSYANASDDFILSILKEEGRITQAKIDSAKKTSAFGNGFSGDKDMGLHTGNLKFFVHGLDYENQLMKFDAFSLVDSDVLLSVSYTERPESKYRFFRAQGVVLDVATENIHGGGNTDAGSGCGKFVQEFKNNYIFGGKKESDRTYIADLIKEATGMTDEEYVRFVKKYKNKRLGEIEPQEVQEKIIKAFATINSNTRKGNRSYNEMYLSNPTVMAVFAYDMNATSNVGNPLDFLGRTELAEGDRGYNGVKAAPAAKRTAFLRKYALDNNLPFIVFGD